MRRLVFAVSGAPIIGGILALALAPTLHRGVIRPLDDDGYSPAHDTNGTAAKLAPMPGLPAAQHSRVRDRARVDGRSAAQVPSSPLDPDPDVTD